MGTRDAEADDRHDAAVKREYVASKAVARFLEEHPKVTLHFTPTYSSWLNQIELWFSGIERDLIARGVFKSVNDLSRKLMRYIRHYNPHPKPIKWKYSNPGRRIVTTNSRVTVHESAQCSPACFY